MTGVIEQTGDAPGAIDKAMAPPSLSDITRTFGRVALLSFGGPAGQIAVMHRILVDEKRWISEERFLHALNFCMLLPGPEAQQLATYTGWLLQGWRGGLIAGLLFVLPGVVAIMALSIVYALLGSVGLVAGLFFGLKAAVLAIVLQALRRLAGRALRTPALRVIAILAFVAIFGFAVPFPVIIGTAAMAGFLGARLDWPGMAPAKAREPQAVASQPTAGISAVRLLRVGGLWLGIWWLPVLVLVATLGPGHVLTTVALFFSRMAVVTFGGAYAVLAYVAQQAVAVHGWLAPGEMLDGLGMAETTPGPLIMVLQFVGFMAGFRHPEPFSPLLAGVLGGLVATWVTFAPCFLWIFAGAPYIEHLRGRPSLNAALSAVTAAVVGVILNLALWFAIHTLFRDTHATRAFGVSLDLPVFGSLDPWALVLSAAAILATPRYQAGLFTVVFSCAACGVALHVLGLR